jgi:colanic acid/amylovoran biosynthesis glycosyltransferase
MTHSIFGRDIERKRSNIVVTFVVARYAADEVAPLLRDYLFRVAADVRVRIVVISHAYISDKFSPSVEVLLLSDLEKTIDTSHAPVDAEMRELFLIQELGRMLDESGYPRCFTLLLNADQVRALILGGAQVIPVCVSGQETFHFPAPIRQFPCVIALSRQTKHNLIKHGHQSHIEVIEHIPFAHPPSKQSRFALRSKFGTPEDVLLIAMTGSVRPQRDYPKAVHILKEVLRQTPAHLVISGVPTSGKLGESALSETMQAISELGLEEYVTFLSPEHEEELIGACDIYLNTSRFEGWDMGILKAIQLGITVVAPAIGGHKDMPATTLRLLPKWATHEDWANAIRSKSTGKYEESHDAPFPSFRLWTLFGMTQWYESEERVVVLSSLPRGRDDGDFLDSLYRRVSRECNVTLLITRPQGVSIDSQTQSQNSSTHYIGEYSDPFEVAERIVSYLVSSKIRVLYLHHVDPRVEILLEKVLHTLPVRMVKPEGYKAIAKVDPRYRFFIDRVGVDSENKEGNRPRTYDAREYSFGYRTQDDELEPLALALIHALKEDSVQTMVPEEKKLKILFVVWQFPTPSEVFLLNQVVGLVRKGHHVDICATGGVYPDSRAHQTPLVTAHRLMDRVVVPVEQVSQTWTFAIPSLEHLRFLFGNIRRLYGRYHTLSPLRRSDKIPFASRNYDIIHCQFGTLTDAAMKYRAQGFIKGPIVTTFQGRDISEYVVEKGRDVYRKAFQESDYFLTVSEAFRERAISLGCPKSKVEVHRSGIDLSLFPYLSPMYPHDGVIHFVTTGRFVEKKGILYAIHAIHELSRMVPNIHYTIIGSGPLGEDFLSLISSLEAEEYITIVDWMPHERMVAFLRATHIFIAPCVISESGDSDGIPNTMVEAMALGLPIVTTRHASIQDMVEDGVTGVVVPQRDVEALRDALEELVLHPTRWEPLARRARERVELLADSEKQNTRLVDIYQRILRTPR